MVGGFSYPLSQLNRTTPGAAPAGLIDQAAHLSRGAASAACSPTRWCSTSRSRCRRFPASPPTTGRRRTTTARAAGSITLRRALENSKNLVTARLLDGGIDKDPTKSLEQICDLALEAKIYPECMKNYPFVLGAQALRMIDLARLLRRDRQRRPARHRPTPSTPSRRTASRSTGTTPAPPVMHGRRRPRGVLSASHHPRRRGDARHRRLDEAPDAASSAARPAPPTTKTTPGSSASPATSPSRSGSATTTPAASRRLGRGGTGGSSPCRSSSRSSQATWNFHAPKTPLPPPSAEAGAPPQGACRSTSTADKSSASAKNGGFTEYFRLDGNKKLRDTQYALAGRHSLARSGPMPAPRRERRPAAAATGCYPSSGPIQWTGCRAHCGNCSGFDVNRSDTQIDHCLMGIKLEARTSWGNSHVDQKLDCHAAGVCDDRRLRRRAGLPDREGGFGRRRHHRLAQAEDHLLHRSPRRRDVGQGRVHPLR